jgi:hypothetical protein
MKMMKKSLFVVICLLSMLLLFSVGAQADTLGFFGLGMDGLTILFAPDDGMFEIDLGGLSSYTIFGVYHLRDKDGNAAGCPYLTIGLGQINRQIADHDNDTAFGYGVGLAWVLDNDYLRNDRLYMYMSGTFLCAGTTYEINGIEYDGGTGFFGKLKLSYTIIDHIPERLNMGERFNFYGVISYVDSNRLDYQKTEYGFGIESVW